MEACPWFPTQVAYSVTCFFCLKLTPQVLTPLVKKQAPALGYPPVACLEEWARLLPPIFQKNTPHFWGKSLRLFFLKKNGYLYGGLQKTQLIINTVVRAGAAFWEIFNKTNHNPVLRGVVLMVSTTGFKPKGLGSIPSTPNKTSLTLHNFLKESNLVFTKPANLHQTPAVLLTTSLRNYLPYWVVYAFVFNKHFLVRNLQLLPKKFIRKRTNFTNIIKTKKFFWSCYKLFVSTI